MTDERSLSDLDAALVAANPELAGEAEATSFSVALARRCLTIRRDPGCTQADLAPEEKDAISHRGRAGAAARAILLRNV